MELTNMGFTCKFMQQNWNGGGTPVNYWNFIGRPRRAPWFTYGNGPETAQQIWLGSCVGFAGECRNLPSGVWQ